MGLISAFWVPPDPVPRTEKSGETVFALCFSGYDTEMG